MILDKLHEVFADAKYPGDRGLADSWPNEWEATFDRLRLVRWPDVQAEDFDSQGGIVEGVQCLSAAGFVYFLPGLIRIAFEDSVNRYAIATALMGRLTFPESKSQTSPALQEEIFKLLTPLQRDYLREILRLLQRVEPNLCAPIVDSAICNLKLGSAQPYGQNDVARWAADRMKMKA